MGTIMGKSGYVYVGMGVAPSAGVIVDSIDNWAYNMTADAIETTSFGTTTAVVHKSFEAGLKGHTGNCAGTFDGTLQSLSVLMTVLTEAHTAVNCVLHMDSAHHMSVETIITGFTLNDAIADKVTFGFDWTAKGDPVYA